MKIYEIKEARTRRVLATANSAAEAAKIQAEFSRRGIETVVR